MPQLEYTSHISCRGLLRSKSASTPCSHASSARWCLLFGLLQSWVSWCSEKDWLLYWPSPPFRLWAGRSTSEARLFPLWSCKKPDGSSSSLWFALISTRSEGWRREVPLQLHFLPWVIHSLSEAARFWEWAWAPSPWRVTSFHQEAIGTCSVTSSQVSQGILDPDRLSALRVLAWYGKSHHLWGLRSSVPESSRKGGRFRSWWFIRSCTQGP